MLSIRAVSAGTGNYYLTPEQRSGERLTYYGESVANRTSGRWLGNGAALLGLSGEVTGEVFRRVFDGFSADGQRKLVQNAGKSEGYHKRKPGWDLTLSAPKSFSLLWSVAEEPLRKQMEAALNRAGQKIIEEVQCAAFTRAGKAGAQVLPARVAVAGFLHTQARPAKGEMIPAPQLHLHLVMVNLGVRVEAGEVRTRSLLSKPFYQKKMELGERGRTLLAQEAMRLGFPVQWSQTEHGRYFEVSGVPTELLRIASKRRAEVSRSLEERGLSGGKEAARAALLTRRTKREVTPETFHAHWREVARAYGLTPESVEGLRWLNPASSLTREKENERPHPSPRPQQERVRSSGQNKSIESQGVSPNASVSPGEKAAPQRIVPLKEVDWSDTSITPEELEALKSRLIEMKRAERFLHGALRESVKSLEARKNSFTERELANRVAERVPRQILLDGVMGHVREYLASREAVSLGKVAGERHFTTRRSYGREATFLADARTLAGGRAGGRSTRLSLRVATAMFRLIGGRLDSEQSEVLNHLARGQGSLRLLHIPSGSEAQAASLLAVARAAWKLGGYRVIGAAPSREAAGLLEKRTGIKSRSFAGLDWSLKSHALTRKTFHGKRFRSLKGILRYAEKAVQPWLRLNRKTIVVVDQAQMLDARQASHLLRRARQSGATLILMGDSDGIQSRPMGGAFRALQERLPGRMAAVRPPGTQEAGQEIYQRSGDGSAVPSLAQLASIDLFHLSRDRYGAIRQVIAAWRKAVRETELRDALLVCEQKDERATLNRLAQNALQEEGKSGTVSTALGDGRLYMGDRVCLSAPSRLLGIRGGERGVVTHIEPLTRNVRIRLDEGRIVWIPLLRYTHLQLAYAVTAEVASLSSAKRLFVLLDDHTLDRHFAKTVMAGGCNRTTRLFADRAMTGGDGTRLARLWERGRPAELAHDRERRAIGEGAVKETPTAPEFKSLKEPMTEQKRLLQKEMRQDFEIGL